MGALRQASEPMEGRSFEPIPPCDGAHAYVCAFWRHACAARRQPSRPWRCGVACHQVHHLRWLFAPRLLDPRAALLLLQKIFERLFVAVFELFRMEMPLGIFSS